MTVWQKLHNEWPTIAAALVALAVAIGGLFGIDPGAIQDAGGEITQVVTSVLGFVAWLHVRRSINGPVTQKRWETESIQVAGEPLIRSEIERVLDERYPPPPRDAGGISADTQGR